MEIKLSLRRDQASVALGIFILVTFVIFMVMFFTCSCRAKKIRPRQLPPEDTNAFNHIQVDWFASTPPQPQGSPPSGAIRQSSDTLPSHTNELTFPWYPNMEGWLIVWRTDDWRNYTMLSYVMYEDEIYRTNDAGDVFVVIGFVDQYALPEQAFYEGIIITNSP